MKRILTGMVAGLIGLTFSATTFAQSAPVAPATPPGGIEKSEKMKERAEKMEERAEKMKEKAEKMKERAEKMKARADKKATSK